MSCHPSTKANMANQKRYSWNILLVAVCVHKLTFFSRLDIVGKRWTYWGSMGKTNLARACYNIYPAKNQHSTWNTGGLQDEFLFFGARASCQVLLLLVSGRVQLFESLLAEFTLWPAINSFTKGVEHWQVDERHKDSPILKRRYCQDQLSRPKDCLDLQQQDLKSHKGSLLRCLRLVWQQPKSYCIDLSSRTFKSFAGLHSQYHCLFTASQLKILNIPLTHLCELRHPT